MPARCLLLDRWRLSIQLPYCNNFETVWECSDAVASGRVDWEREVGPMCPICGRCSCWRRITPYRRTVIELFPYREGRILVARFLCQKTGQTFSLLPVCLVPYHHYTAGSMLFALLLTAAKKEHGLQSLFAVAEKKLDVECRGDRTRHEEALVRGAVAVTAGRPRHPGQGVFAQAAQACAASVIGGFHPGGVARVAQGHRSRNR